MDKEQQQKPLDEQTATSNAEEKNKEDTQNNNQAKAEESNKEKEISPEEKISECRSYKVK
jgi:molecular chaperone GrpE